MTSFFEHQDRARRNTKVLVLLMALGVLAMGSAIYLLLTISLPAVGAGRLSRAVGERIATFDPQLLLVSIAGTAVLVALASGSRVLSLRGGGSQIAEMLGGRLISGQPRDALERRLVNVVEEMAIASGVPVPQVFVLDEETGINAFAAGFTLDDAAITATRGALEKLTRDELQGVIAHEFSHVLNGDMRLNIHLMGIVFGILCIGLLGRFMMRIVGTTRFSSSRRDRGGSLGAAIFVFGLGVFLVGAIGEFFGKVIKAAVSRQREFLADASAVQFTRNPGGIAGALKKIGGYPGGARLAAPHAEEASHFFFGDIHTRLFGGSIFATHPPLAERIRRIEPGFAGEFPEVGEGIAQPEEPTLAGFAQTAGTGPTPQASKPAAAEVVGRVGTLPTAALDQGRKLRDRLPEGVRQAIQNPFSACAVVYALLLADEPKLRDKQRSLITRLSSGELELETRRLLPSIAPLPRRSRLPLIELLAPALRELSRDQRAAFSSTVDALIHADNAVSIFEYVLGAVLRDRMSGSTRSAHGRVRHGTLQGVRAELNLLLSLLAHAGAMHEGDAERAFAVAVTQVPDMKLALLPRSDRLLPGLSGALTELRDAAPRIRAQIVDACAHAVLADRRVTEDEATLLRAICDGLRCPLPPFADATEV